MSDITAHSEKYGDLPLFPPGQWVATDDDVESWSDLLYMRALADELEARRRGLAANPQIVVHILAMLRLLDAAEMDVMAMTPWPSNLMTPWPADHAADMLAAWRIEAVA